MERISLKVVMLENGMDLPLPSYATPGSAGMDLMAACHENMYLGPSEIKAIPTGISLQLVEGKQAEIRSRSGLSLKGIVVMNSPGTIDSDYRGEIKVILSNQGKEGYTVKRGDKVAQMIITNYTKADLILVSSLDETSRGSGGFGSTDST